MRSCMKPYNNKIELVGVDMGISFDINVSVTHTTSGTSTIYC